MIKNKRKDPEGRLIRTEDGFLALQIVRDKKDQKKKDKDAPAYDWEKIRSKDKLEVRARKDGIEFDKREKLDKMKEAYAAALKAKEQPEE